MFNTEVGLMKILFICTGNYYRSRFAEIYFNHLAPELKIEDISTSRGVNPCCFTDPISDSAVHFLESVGVKPTHPYRNPMKLTDECFKSNDLFIALDEQEHRPMIERIFPYWADQIEYWRVPDRPILQPNVALPMIAKNVENLLYKLSTR
jgi:protein-tyrosine phosphatase